MGGAGFVGQKPTNRTTSILTLIRRGGSKRLPRILSQQVSSCFAIVTIRQLGVGCESDLPHVVEREVAFGYPQ